MTPNIKRQIPNTKSGFSLIELIVAMSILVMVMGGMVAVSVSIFRSYQKSRAIKTVTEDIGFALNSIAKDVRMGKIETSTDGKCLGTGLLNNCIMITRNATKTEGGVVKVQKTCYKIDAVTGSVGVKSSPWFDKSLVDSAYTTCDLIPESGFQKIVDLSATNMTLSPNSGFYSLPTNKTAGSENQGWVEINLDVQTGTGAEMETDSIQAQTTVSSRDYDWKEVN